MTDKKTTIWNSRDIHYETWSTEDSEVLMDALVKRLWGAPNALRNHFWRTPSVGCCGVMVHVQNFPRYIPMWYARRVVAKVAAKAGVSGAAYAHIERNVLVNH